MCFILHTHYITYLLHESVQLIINSLFGQHYIQEFSTCNYNVSFIS